MLYWVMERVCVLAKGKREKTGWRGENKEMFVGSRQEVIDRGYEPCGRCKP